jgi:thiamine kinase-like enzyme
MEQAMADAAAWIGRFHAINESHATSPATQFLVRYTPEFYIGWVRRTIEFLALLDIDEPWLIHLCEGSIPLLVGFAEQTPTVIHGEYYPMNILVRDDSDLFPIDWESAAIAVGEIDLASLTEDWSEDVVRLCQEAYVQARWPSGAPDDYPKRLDVARLYLHFRWLCDRVEWTRASLKPQYLSELRSIGERLGLC